MNVSIILDKVSKKYGNQSIFSQLNLKLEKGAYVLKGPNGVGKSTLIKLITGLEPVDEGEVYVNRLSIKDQRYSVNQIRTYLPDQPAFYENVTVKELITVILSIRKISQSQVKDLIEYWELDSLFPLRWKALSLGQRKRVFYAVSLLETAPVWILDEPSNGLDKVWIPKLAEVVLRHSAHGLILFSSHDETFMNFVQPVQLNMNRLDGRTEITSKTNL
jgi:ABC-type multidrug transport system ATPase subunit